MASVDWKHLALDQLVWHWDVHARPHLDGLSDDEYRWEPAPGCWNVRRRDEAVTSHAAGAGDYVLDFEMPEPDPAPPTTIAWRMAHLIVGIFGMRNASHFGGPSMDYQSFEYAPDAATALAQLDEGYERWVTGVRSLDADGLARAVGPAEGPFAEHPYDRGVPP